MPTGGHNKNHERYDRIMAILSDKQWHISTDIAEQVGGKRTATQRVLWNMRKKGEIEARKAKVKKGDEGRAPHEYRKRPSNLFNPDEFADYYRDPVGEGMSLKRHPDHVHL